MCSDYVIFWYFQMIIFGIGTRQFLNSSKADSSKCRYTRQISPTVIGSDISVKFSTVSRLRVHVKGESIQQIYNFDFLKMTNGGISSIMIKHKKEFFFSSIQSTYFKSQSRSIRASDLSIVEYPIDSKKCVQS